MRHPSLLEEHHAGQHNSAATRAFLSGLCRFQSVCLARCSLQREVAAGGPLGRLRTAQEEVVLQVAAHHPVREVRSSNQRSAVSLDQSQRIPCNAPAPPFPFPSPAVPCLLLQNLDILPKQLRPALQAAILQTSQNCQKPIANGWAGSEM